jgi:competence protein ComFC
MKRLRRLISPVLELIIPRGCAGCERTLTGDETGWCAECATALADAAAGEHCGRCGAALGPHLSTDGCRNCRDPGWKLDGFARVGAYHGTIGSLVKRFKFGRQHRLDRPLGEFLAASFQGQPWSSEVDALVPIPIGLPGRIRYRAHPAGLLAFEVSARVRLPSLPLLAARGKKLRQVELPRSDRQKNVTGVYHLRPHARVAGTKLCLIDDVSTTGATLNAAAAVLKRAGAAAVYAAVLAKTEEGHSDAL